VIAALLTAFCFAGAGVSARRSTVLLGAERANLLRLLVGVGVLGVVAAIFWKGMSGAVGARFALAGVIGFGGGGYCMMHALRLLGSPRALLGVESLTAIFAGGLAWGVLGDPLTVPQLLSCLVILGGVLWAGSAWSEGTVEASWRERRAGFVFALLASGAQALSLVLSRQAFLLAAQGADVVGKFDAAFLRLLGGGAFAILILALAARPQAEAGKARRLLDPGASWRGQPLLWGVVNGLCGPVLGVTCWLWAVSLLHPAIVQSVAATAPLLSVPLSRTLEPGGLGGRFFTGAPLAILGIVGLVFLGS
jgi:drug/metabolite transporter (DMT)-like permease